MFVWLGVVCLLLISVDVSCVVVIISLDFWLVWGSWFGWLGLVIWRYFAGTVVPWFGFG